MQIAHSFSRRPRIGLICVLLCLSFPVMLQAEEKGTAYYDFGVFAFEENDLTDAEQNFQKALAADPRNERYQYYLGKTYLKMKRHEEAQTLLSEILQKNGTLEGLKYDLAMTHFYLGQFSEAGSLLSIVIAENPADVLAIYHLGICHFKQERYQSALPYFASAAEKNPGIRPNCALYAGICHFRMGELEQASQEFTVAADHAQLEEVKQQARKWQRSVQDRIKAQRPYRLYGKIGGQYDDNVPLEPIDEDLYANEGDWGLVGFLGGRYRLVETKNSTFGLGYNHYQIAYREFSDFNMIAATPNLFTTYAWSPLFFALSYQPTYYWVGSDDYLLRHQVRPEITWQMTSRFSSRFAFTYFGNNHFANSGRSGRTLGVDAELRYGLEDEGTAVFGGFSCQDNDTTHPDYAYQQASARLGASVALPFRLLMTVGGRFDLKTYDNIDSIYAERRKDRKCAVDLTVYRDVYSDWLGAECTYGFTKNDSDIDRYDYRSHTVTLAAVMKF